MVARADYISLLMRRVWAIYRLDNLLLSSIQIARPEKRDRARVVWARPLGYV